MFLKAHKYWPLKGLEILGEHFILYLCMYGGQDVLS